MSKIILADMTFEDQLQICKWRMKHNKYSRQSPLNDLKEWYQEQLRWFYTYDKKTNHYFSILDYKTQDLIGVIALTSIDTSNFKAEVHHFIGENYIDPVRSKQAVDFILEYSRNFQKLNSLYVETFEHDTLKFNFFKEYGFTHVGLWPNKSAKIIEGNLKFIDVNIQTFNI